MTALSIVGTQRGILAISMKALETDKCHEYAGFVYGYGKDDFQHKFQSEQEFQVPMVHSDSCFTAAT